MAARLKKGDTVVVISGKDSGKKGKIISFSNGGVIIEKINIAKRATKPSKNFQGGIIEKPMPVNPSKVMLVCAKCNDGVRVKYEKVEDKTYRKCASCGDMLDKVK